MRSWLKCVLSVGPLPVLAAALLAPAIPPARKPAAPAFDRTASAFFKQSCTSCHNATAKAGGLDLQPFGQPVSVQRSREMVSASSKAMNGNRPPASVGMI